MPRCQGAPQVSVKHAWGFSLARTPTADTRGEPDPALLRTTRSLRLPPWLPGPWGFSQEPEFTPPIPPNPLTPRRFVTAHAAAAIGLGLLTVPAAQANPEASCNWYPVEYDLGADDARAWLATMAASGKGVVFSGDRFRDYDASTDTWGAWKRRELPGSPWEWLRILPLCAHEK